MPAHLPSDKRRPEPWRQALRGFFADVLRIAAVGVGALVAALLADGGSGDAYRVLLEVALLSMIGAGLGALLPGLLPPRWRAPRLLPLGALALALALVWVAVSPSVPLPLCVAIGALGGLLNVPMIVAYQHAVPADARGNAMAMLNTAGYLSITVLSLAMAGLSAARVLGGREQLVAVAALAGLVGVLGWHWLRDARGVGDGSVHRTSGR